MDQMVSAQPVLISQMAGVLTNLHIWGAVFLLIISWILFMWLSCVNLLLMRLFLLSLLLKDMQTMEELINSYQANNGWFADADFQHAIKEANQTITFCAVGAHHQNGIIKRWIKELTVIYCTLLLHAKCHWPKYVMTMMCPFALKETAYWLNQPSLSFSGWS